MGLRLDAVLVVGALLGILSSSPTRLASGLSEAGECAGQLGPVPGSATKPQVTWRLDNASTGAVKFVVSRYVAYSGMFKYVSLAFATKNQMPSTNVIVDCYEKSSGPQVATSRNVNYTNLPDIKLNSRIWGISARRVDTNLSCSFSAMIQPDETFLFMATGAMSEGLKSKHTEKYIFATSEIRCSLEAALSIVRPSTTSASRPTVAASTTVMRVIDQTRVPSTAATGVSPLRTVGRTTSGSRPTTEAEQPNTLTTSTSAVASGTSSTAIPKLSTLITIKQSQPVVAASSEAVTLHVSSFVQRSSIQQLSTKPEVRISDGSLRSAAASPTTARTLTSSTTQWIGDVIDVDYSAAPEPVDPLDSSNNKQSPSTTVATARTFDSSAKEATSAAGNRPLYVIITMRSLLPEAGTTVSVANGRDARNSSLPDSAVPGDRKQLSKNTASSDGDHMPRLLCMAACLCVALATQFACGRAVPALSSLWKMLAMNTA